MSNRIGLIIFLQILTGLSFNCAAWANDVLGIGVPYTIEKIRLQGISYSRVKEPINSIIIANTSYGLIQREDEKRYRLRLASTFTVKDKGKTLEILLKDGLRFSNGERLTPERLISSIEFWRRFSKDRQFTSSPEPVALSDIENINVISPEHFYHTSPATKTVVMTLKAKSEKSLLALAELPLVDSDIANLLGRNLGTGTFLPTLGPYYLAGNTNSSTLTLHASRYFYRENTPKVPKIVFLEFSSSRAALKALRTGKISIIALATDQLIKDSQQDPTLTVKLSPLNNLLPKNSHWQLQRSFWSDKNNPEDILRTDKVILRKALQTDQYFDSSFELSGCFLE